MLGTAVTSGGSLFPLNFPATTFPEEQDEQCMQALACGDHEAINPIYRRYWRLVYSIALQIVRDAAEAEDVVQTVFLDVFRAARQFDAAKGTVKVWLLQYAYHRALHRKRHLVANRLYDWVELGTCRSVRSEWATRAESACLTKQLLGLLKPRQRRVVELTYYEGLTAKEISSHLAESVHVVRHDLRRALVALREANLEMRGEGSDCI